MEIRAYLSYSRIKEPLTFWRSLNGQEVDYLIGEDWAIEVKATTRVSDRDFRGLRAIAEEKTFRNLLFVSQDKINIKYDDIQCLHWESFLEKLWGGEVISQMNS